MTFLTAEDRHCVFQVYWKYLWYIYLVIYLPTHGVNTCFEICSGETKSILHVPMNIYIFFLNKFLIFLEQPQVTGSCFLRIHVSTTTIIYSKQDNSLFVSTFSNV